VNPTIWLTNNANIFTPMTVAGVDRDASMAMQIFPKSEMIAFIKAKLPNHLNVIIFRSI
jgi:hypothetical protein